MDINHAIDHDLDIQEAKTSFVDALYSRFADPKYSECNSCELFIIGSLSPGKSGNSLILPPGLSLNGCGINKAGSPNKIRESCFNVEELDLTCNSLTDLNQVFCIVKEMPNLRFLNLSENDFSKTRLQPVSSNVKSNDDSMGNVGEESKFESIKSLVLNNTSIPWTAVEHLLRSMPNLTELHLSLNNYTSMEMLSMYPKINRLYISGNPNLNNWQEIANLVSAFPALEGLTMADCNISMIPETLEDSLPFVQSLNITNWPISQWEFLERLNTLPNLIELRCQGLKVLDSINDDESRRHHLIARLPRVKRLNGSEINEDERICAERAFVRWYLVNDHLNRPQRFYTLHSIYGRVDPLAEVDLSPPKTAQVTVVYNENFSDSSADMDSSGESLPDSRDITINLNKSVKEFKQQLASMFGLVASQIRVFYVDHVMMEVMGPEEMKFNQKKLFTYNVQDGDQFIVDSK